MALAERSPARPVGAGRPPHDRARADHRPDGAPLRRIDDPRPGRRRRESSRAIQHLAGDERRRKIAFRRIAACRRRARQRDRSDPLRVRRPFGLPGDHRPGGGLPEDLEPSPAERFDHHQRHGSAPVSQRGPDQRSVHGRRGHYGRRALPVPDGRHGRHHGCDDYPRSPASELPDECFAKHLVQVHSRSDGVLHRLDLRRRADGLHRGRHRPRDLHLLDIRLRRDVYPARGCPRM